jgi:hypothetical protein
MRIIIIIDWTVVNACYPFSDEDLISVAPAPLHRSLLCRPKTAKGTITAVHQKLQNATQPPIESHL